MIGLRLLQTEEKPGCSSRALQRLMLSALDDMASADSVALGLGKDCRNFTHLVTDGVIAFA